MANWKSGEIVRYSGGCSALVQLDSPHAGGWHATHCLGGTIFVSESYPSTMHKASAEDVATYNELRAKTLKQQGRA